MTSNDLRNILQRIDHKGYPAYKDTKGSYDFGDYILNIDHVQGDPFASPSKLSVKVSGDKAGFAKQLYDTDSRRVSLEDHLLRSFGRQIREFSKKADGSGKSGLISVSSPGQEVLKRSAVSISVSDGSVLIRFQVGFPARGRTVMSGELIKILFEYLPVCVRKSLYAKAHSSEKLQQIADLADDRDYIRQQLQKQGLVSFVGDGSILPRKSGVSPLPMKDAILFQSPDELAVTMDLPHKGKLRGMGIPKGVTLIIGGGYHGKSTLLSALQLGVYDHIAGDGREYVITDDTAVKLRAEDGRSVTDMDISMFIRNLPSRRDTTHFSTQDASGSTSQAANTMEAIEAGSRCFLIDEDTSATNFMIRDELMQKVVTSGQEPIIPFIDRIRPLYDQMGISTILVAGSCGSYFYKADTIIQMMEYKPMDVTKKAKEIAEQYKTDQTADGVSGEKGKTDLAGSAQTEDSKQPLTCRFDRIPKKVFFRDGDRVKTKSFGTDGFSINRDNVELRFVEQIADGEQINALADILVCLQKEYFDGKRTVQDCVEALYAKIEEKGFAAIGQGRADSLAMPRKQEVYAMVSRVRGL